MSFERRLLAIGATAFLLSNLFAALASGGSHYPLTVVLWEDNAEQKTAGQTVTAWAQVYSGEAPTNATNVTFHWGLNFPPFVFAAAVNGTYAGSPGLYRANVTVTAGDVGNGFGFLEVTATRGNQTATNSRIVYLGASVLPAPPGPVTGWTVSAGVENMAELTPAIKPGDTMVWAIDTALNGVATDAPSLLARLFEAPEVTYSETPTDLSPVRASTGHYTVSTVVPASLSASIQYALQATIDEGSFASANATTDVWFYDTLVDFSALNLSSFSGTLTVGDWAVTKANVTVSLELSATSDSHHIGWVNGTTDGSGRLPFSVANDGSTEIQVKGWMNGSFMQRITAVVRLPPAFTAPAPTVALLDAVPLENPGAMPWDRTQTIHYAIYQNGSRWANRTVHAFASSARGILTAANLTSDANGTVALAIDFSRVNPVSEDFVFQGFNQGLNITFRSAIGADANSSDGAFWGEDEERVWPQPIPAVARMLFDTNLTFATEPMSIGAPFGVGAKYLGAKNVTGFKGAAALFPSSVNTLFDGATERFAVWTAHGDPIISYLAGGNAAEFFGRLSVPPYWPNTTYTLLGAVIPSFGVLGQEGGPAGGALNWISIRPGQSLAEFLPAPDTTPPEIWGPRNFTAPSYHADFVTHVHDNSLDFGTVGTVIWQFDDGTGPKNFTGQTGSWDFRAPGNYTVTITATDGSGNRADHTFVVTILDRVAPLAAAGADFSALGGVEARFGGIATDDDPSFGATATYSWSFLYNGSQVNLSGLAPTFTFWTLGTYTVTFSATDPAGNRGNDTLEVTVLSPDTTAPTVDAGVDRTLDAGVPVALAGTATDNDANFPLGATCLWTFLYNGTAQQANQTDFSFTFWSLGPVDLTFSCMDFWGNEGNDSVRLTVQKPDRAAPSVNAGPDIAVMAGTPAVLSGLVSDNDPAFPAFGWIAWSFVYNATPQNLTGPNATFTFFVPGVYTLLLSASDGWGNLGTDSVQVSVRVPDTLAPVVTGIASQTVFVGAPLALTAVVIDNDNTFPLSGNISWSFDLNGTLVASYGTAFSFAFPLPGTFTVTLAALDAAGNRAFTTFLVTVRVPDTTAPTVIASVDRASMEVGQTVTFTGAATDQGAALTDPSLFEWTFTDNGAPKVLQGLSPSFQFNQPGTYVVTLRVLDAAGNNGTAQVTVTVTARPSGGTTTQPGDLTLYLLLVIVAVAAVAAFLKMRPKALEGAPLRDDSESMKPSGKTAPTQPDKDGKASQGEEDKDLDDLLG